VLDTGGNDTWQVAAGGSSLNVRCPSPSISGGVITMVRGEAKSPPTTPDAPAERRRRARPRAPIQRRARVSRAKRGALGVGILVDLGAGTTTTARSASQGSASSRGRPLRRRRQRHVREPRCTRKGRRLGHRFLLDGGGDAATPVHSSAGAREHTCLAATRRASGDDVYFTNPVTPRSPKATSLFLAAAPDRGTLDVARGGQGRRSHRPRTHRLPRAGVLRTPPRRDTVTRRASSSGVRLPRGGLPCSTRRRRHVRRALVRRNKAQTRPGDCLFPRRGGQ